MAKVTRCAHCPLRVKATGGRWTDTGLPSYHHVQPTDAERKAYSAGDFHANGERAMPATEK